MEQKPIDVKGLIAQIRKRRIELGLSHDALAACAGVSRDLLIKMEQGRHENPTGVTVNKILVALGNGHIVVNHQGRAA